jgi:hypothetical protein
VPEAPGNSFCALTLIPVNKEAKIERITYGFRYLLGIRYKLKKKVIM